MGPIDLGCIKNIGNSYEYTKEISWKFGPKRFGQCLTIFFALTCQTNSSLCPDVRWGHCQCTKPLEAGGPCLALLMMYLENTVGCHILSLWRGWGQDADKGSQWLLGQHQETQTFLCCTYTYPNSKKVQYLYVKYTVLVTSLRPSAAYMRKQPMISLVQIMACRLFGAKPLSEPMLDYCQLEPWEQTSVQF